MPKQNPSPKISNIGQRRMQARQSGDKEYLERRAQLLKVAGDIFKAKGYQNASINDFAEAMGIDRASLYYYTSGKEELFQEIIQDVTLSNILMIEKIRDSDLPPAEKVDELIVSLQRSFERHYPYLFVYIQEEMTHIAAKSGPWADEMNDLAARFDRAMISIIQEGIDDGSFRMEHANARIIAFGIIGMCNWSHRWFRPTGRASAETIGRTFSEMVLTGLRGGSRVQAHTAR